VAASNATVLQYVGELCRYLVNSSHHPQERQHKVRMAWGNGMRADVWERFRERFNIPVIHELYAATDGLSSSFNRNCGAFSRGAIGVRGKIWEHVMGNREVRARIDPDTEELMRTTEGRAIRSAVGEPGEVLMKIDPALAAAAFKGYFENATSTEKRWLRDVFEKGDLWFRSGDVMRQDADGRLYFVDRLGDTFRWKSENVSTNEVADVLGAHPQLAEVSVYGVSVPNADGRCGCATIVLQSGVDVAALDRAKLAAHVRDRLPRYAVPVFLRVTPALSYTGTFKIQKGQAKREGIDLDLIKKSGSRDVVLWLPPGAAQYEPYRREDWEALRSGQLKL
jgi:acyl-CoA synthetase (AMP-forming)/AMP-acid ligase II